MRILVFLAQFTPLLSAQNFELSPYAGYLYVEAVTTHLLRM